MSELLVNESLPYLGFLAGPVDTHCIPSSNAQVDLCLIAMKGMVRTVDMDEMVSLPCLKWTCLLQSLANI